MVNSWEPPGRTSNSEFSTRETTRLSRNVKDIRVQSHSSLLGWVISPRFSPADSMKNSRENSRSGTSEISDPFSRSRKSIIRLPTCTPTTILILRSCISPERERVCSVISNTARDNSTTTITISSHPTQERVTPCSQNTVSMSTTVKLVDS